MIILIATAAFILGATLCFFTLCFFVCRFARNGLFKKALAEAEIIKKNKIVEAKEKFIALKTEHENMVRQQEQKRQQADQRLQQREQQLNQRQGELQRQQNELKNRTQQIEKQQQVIDYKTSEAEKLHQQARQQLEALSGLSAAEAKKQLVDSLKDEARTEALSFINETMDEARLNANMEAKKVIIKTIQRVASEATVENAVSIFRIENDEVKGALEAATGVEIVVDDTPECITLSAFDPVRREIARLSLHQLVQDGRIHPARIEEVVAKVTEQIEEEIIEIGKRTTIDLGIHGLHPELIRLVGKMKYRSSYNTHARRQTSALPWLPNSD